MFKYHNWTIRLREIPTKYGTSACIGLALLVATVLLFLLLIEEPLMTIAAVGGICLCIVSFRSPKSFAILGTVIVLFAPSLAAMTGIRLLDMADEIVVILIVLTAILRIFVLGKKFKSVPGLYLFIGFFAIGMTSGLVTGVSIFGSLESAFLTIKGQLLYFAVAQLNWSIKDLRLLRTFGVYLFLTVAFFAVINMLFPEQWRQIMGDIRGGVQYRSFGFPSLFGPFQFPVSLGQVSSLLLLGAAAYIRVFGSTKYRFLVILGSISMVFLSFRRKAIASSVIGLLFVMTLMRKSRLSTVLLIAITAPLIVLVSLDSIVDVAKFTYIEYFTNPDDQARIVMYRDSVGLAFNNFPFGAGFSQFGSYVAGRDYSPIYVALGYESIWGLGHGERGGFLSDTFWPAILGETGFLGAIAYAGILIAIFRCGVRLVHGQSPKMVKWLGLMVAGWSVEFIVESIAAPVYSSPPTYAIFFLIAGIGAAIDRALAFSHDDETPSVVPGL